MIAFLRCEVCDKTFTRAPTGKPARTCSKRCRARAYYLAHNGAARQRRPAAKAPRPYRQRPRTPERIEYERGYNRRPEVMARQAARQREHYSPTTRARKVHYPTVDVATPYQGHRWLDMAREVVGVNAYGAPGTEASDRYYDDLGEALLALMEGRDPVEALREYRKREFTPRHLTTHIGDWASGDDDYDQQRWDAVMPTAPSAEDEVIAMETVIRHIPLHWGHGKGMMGTSRQGTPSNRRMNAA